jgi:hypothetical protein
MKWGLLDYVLFARDTKGYVWGMILITFGKQVP